MAVTVRLLDQGRRLRPHGAARVAGALGVHVLHLYGEPGAALTFDRLYSVDGQPVLLSVDVVGGESVLSGWSGPGELSRDGAAVVFSIEPDVLERLYLASACFDLSGGRGLLARGIGVLEGARWYASAFAADDDPAARSRVLAAMKSVFDLAGDLLGDWRAVDASAPQGVGDWLRSLDPGLELEESLCDSVAVLLRYFGGEAPSRAPMASSEVFEAMAIGATLSADTGTPVVRRDPDHPTVPVEVKGEGQHCWVRLAGGADEALVWLLAGSHADDHSAAVLASGGWNRVDFDLDADDLDEIRVKVAPIGMSSQLVDDVDELVGLQREVASSAWVADAREVPWPRSDQTDDLRRLGELHLAVANTGAAGQAFALGQGIDPTYCRPAHRALGWPPFRKPPGGAIWARLAR